MSGLGLPVRGEGGRHRVQLAVTSGLALALAGPALLAIGCERLPAGLSAVAKSLIGQIGMWTLLGGIVAITLLWERRPLASLGLRPLRVSSLLSGLVAAAILVYAVVPLATAVVSATGLPGFEGALARVLALPLWLRAVAVVTGGLVEEVLFRGYAITRLEGVTGSSVVAATLSVLVFAAAHWPVWGPGPVLSFVLSGAFLATWFLWRRDLLANVVAHAVVDALGLVFALPTR